MKLRILGLTAGITDTEKTIDSATPSHNVQVVGLNLGHSIPITLDVLSRSDVLYSDECETKRFRSISNTSPIFDVISMLHTINSFITAQ